MLPCEEKLKFEFEKIKFSLLLKVAFSRQKSLQTSLFSNKLSFFPQIQILIFLRQTTRNDHNRLLYKFENDQKNCGYMPASVNYFHMWYIFWVFSCVVCSLVIGSITYFAKTRKKKGWKKPNNASGLDELSKVVLTFHCLNNFF